MDKKILVLFAHPQLHRSRVNRVMADAVRDLPGVTFHDLYATYPQFFIDVEREQALLLAHDLVVFQHPFYWYSSPSILKEWQDAVLELGWAYGEGGKKLHGKHFLSVITAGGTEPAYRSDGYNRYPIEEFLRPFEQTAHLCGMHWHRPLMMQGSIRADAGAIAAHAERYRQILSEFVERGAVALEKRSHG